MLLLNFRNELTSDEDRAIINQLGKTSLYQSILCPINTSHTGLLIDEVCETVRGCLEQVAIRKVELTLLLLPYHSVKAAFIIACYHRMYGTLPNVLQFGYAGIGSESITKVAIATSLERCIDIWKL